MLKKAIILSDTHGYIEDACKVIEKLKDADTIFHLGDMADDAEKLKKHYPQKTVYSVAGNNDYYSSAPLEQLVSFGGKKILITHGHKNKVSYGYLNISLYAIEKGADAVFFGHTHMPFSDTFMGIAVFNPGSISMPRGGNEKTYGILEISEAGSIYLQVYSV